MVNWRLKYTAFILLQYILLFVHAMPEDILTSKFEISWTESYQCWYILDTFTGSHTFFDAKRWTVTHHTIVLSEEWHKASSKNTLLRCNYTTERAVLAVSASHIKLFEWHRLGFRPTIQGLLLQASRLGIPVV